MLIFLEEIKAIEDPEGIVNIFQDMGVGMTIDTEHIDLNDWKKGKEVEVVLTGIPVMTMSIPPQLAGNSIKSVELVQ